LTAQLCSGANMYEPSAMKLLPVGFDAAEQNTIGRWILR
jgi:hypothetical protein